VRHSPRRNLRRGQGLPREAQALEEVVDRTLENRLLKSMIVDRGDEA
jgi:hypothetical protein